MSRVCLIACIVVVLGWRVPGLSAREFFVSPTSQEELKRHYALVKRFSWPGSRTGPPDDLVAALAAPGTHPMPPLQDDPFFAGAGAILNSNGVSIPDTKNQTTEDDDPFFSGAKQASVNEDDDPFFEDVP